MKKLSVFLPLAFAISLLLVFAMRLANGGASSILPSALIDRPAPTFELPAIDGLSDAGLTSTDLANGEITVLNIWASWCAPCRAEHPYIERLGTRDDISLIGINYKDTIEGAHAFLTELGNPYERIGFDKTGRVGIEFGVYGVPETYIVDGKGIIRFKHVGPVTDKVIEKEIDPMIAQLKAAN